MELNEIASYFPLTTFELRRSITWGANNSVYGTYAELLEFNDCYKGIVLFCHVINKY